MEPGRQTSTTTVNDDSSRREGSPSGGDARHGKKIGEWRAEDKSKPHQQNATKPGTFGPQMHEDQLSPGLRWSFGQRSTPLDSDLHERDVSQNLQGPLRKRTSFEEQRTQPFNHAEPQDNVASSSRSQDRGTSLRNPHNRFSPSKNSSTSDEEGMIKEGEQEEGEVNDAEFASDARTYRDHTRPHRSSSGSQAPANTKAMAARHASTLSERFSTTAPGPSNSHSRKWTGSSTEGRIASSGSRDLSRGDSYQPARYRSPDRDREFRSSQTPKRFPMTRPYEESSSTSTISAASAPPPPPPLDVRGSLRAADSYRPGSTNGPSRPSLHRPISSGSLADETRSSHRREWGRDRDHPRERDRDRDRMSVSPASSSRDDFERERKERWRSGGNVPPSPTHSHHSLPPPPRSSFSYGSSIDDDIDARRAMSGSGGSNSRMNTGPWVAGANAQQMKYNRWGSTSQSVDTKKERPFSETRDSGSRHSDAAISRQNLAADEQAGKSGLRPFPDRSEEVSSGVQSASSRPSSPSFASPASPTKRGSHKKNALGTSIFEPSRSDSGWGARSRGLAANDDAGEGRAGEGEALETGPNTSVSSSSSRASLGAAAGNAGKSLLDRISGPIDGGPLQAERSPLTKSSNQDEILTGSQPKDQETHIKVEASADEDVVNDSSASRHSDDPSAVHAGGLAPDLSATAQPSSLSANVSDSPLHPAEAALAIVSTSPTSSKEADAAELPNPTPVKVESEGGPSLAAANDQEAEASNERVATPERPMGSQHAPSTAQGENPLAAEDLNTVAGFAATEAAALQQDSKLPSPLGSSTMLMTEDTAPVDDQKLHDTSRVRASVDAASTSRLLDDKMDVVESLQAANTEGTGATSVPAESLPTAHGAIEESQDMIAGHTRRSADVGASRDPSLDLAPSAAIAQQTEVEAETAPEVVTGVTSIEQDVDLDRGPLEASDQDAKQPSADLITSVKDAVVLAEAAAEDQSMAEIDETIERRKRQDEDQADVDTADGTVEADADDEETGDLGLRNRKSRAEIEEIRTNAVRKAILSRLQAQDDASTSNWDDIVRANRELAKTTTHKLLESAVWGPPFPELDKTFDVYAQDESTRQVQNILLRRQQDLNTKLSQKKQRLRAQYKALNNEWRAHCERLDKAAELREDAQKSVTQPNTPNVNQTAQAEEVQTPLTAGPMISTMGGRANRRGGGAQSGFGFGDAVRSEAEFLEILASLESADMQDPDARAARTATTVPDQEINPLEDKLMVCPFDDRNHFVKDPVRFYVGGFDPDYWSPEEKSIFARKYALWPKQFGRIAGALPNKTANQCVYYYYLTKHQPGHDYKAITAARNRNQKRKTRMKPKKAKGSALMADLKSARGEELMEEDEGIASPLDSSGTRSRMLSGIETVGSNPVADEEPASATLDQTSSYTRKRKNGEDAAQSLDSALGAEKRPKGSGRGGRRVKGQGKKAAAAAAAMATSMAPPDDSAIPAEAFIPPAASDGDLAAAEALGALAASADGTHQRPQQHQPIDTNDINGSISLQASSGFSLPTVTPSGKSKKRKASGPSVEGAEEGATQRKPRNTTSSYWSIQERAEFLRALAVHGKDWSTVSASLVAKSAAQARNYFSRNAEVPDFVEAAELAISHASLPLEVREQRALEWSKERLASEEGSKGLPLHSSNVASGAATGASSARSGLSPTDSKDTSPEPPRRGGMGIMSLLNDEPAPSARKKPTIHEWFGATEERPMPSSDDTLGPPSSDEPGYADHRDSNGAGWRAVPSSRFASVNHPEPRPYLPEARTYPPAPEARHPSSLNRAPEAAPISRNLPTLSISGDPTGRTVYSHTGSNAAREDYVRTSRSPAYDSLPTTAVPLSSHRSTSGGGEYFSSHADGRTDHLGPHQHARHSPVFDRARSTPQAFERSSSMAPRTLGIAEGRSWSTTSSAREVGAEEYSGRSPLHAMAGRSASGSSQHSSGHTANRLGLPTPSRSANNSPFPSPGAQTHSPSAYGGMQSSSYLSARPMNGDGGHRPPSTSPYVRHSDPSSSMYAERTEGRPDASNGVSARVSPLPPPPLPRPSSRDEYTGTRRSEISAAAAGPPAPPRLPPPSSLMRPGTSAGTEGFDDHRQQPERSRELPPPPQGAASHQNQYRHHSGGGGGGGGANDSPRWQ